MNNNQNGKLNNSANQDVSYKWQDPIEQAQEYANEQMEDYGKENLLYDNDDLSITYRTDHIDEISIQNKTNKSIEFVYVNVNDDNNQKRIVISENTSVSLCETELGFTNICDAVRNQTFSYKINQINMSMNYKDMSVVECAAFALSNLEGQDAEIFEAFYDESPDNVDVESFTFGGNDDFWNIVANIFEGNIEEFDAENLSENEISQLIEENKICAYGDTYFDLSDFDSSLGARLEKNMLKTFANVIFADDFMKILFEDEKVKYDWDYKYDEATDTFDIVYDTDYKNTFKISVARNFEDILNTLRETHQTFSIEKYDADCIPEATFIKQALENMYNTAKDIAKEKFYYEIDKLEQPKLTLKQALEQTGRAEFDISDTVFDSFCVAFVYDTGAKELLGEDDYNKVLGWMAENIEVKSFDDGTAECKVSDFIEKNYELFKNFCNEHNNDYYQMDRKDIDTNIEIALATVKSLIVGGYGDKAYSELANEIDKDKNEPSHEDEER